jgi:hypothetical protein
MREGHRLALAQGGHHIGEAWRSEARPAIGMES